VIGKGITRFHAVYWLAFLLSAELPLPTRIAVHGYLTVDGEKISKSLNPAPVPPVLEHWGVDPLRWHFTRRCRTCADSDIPRDALGDAYNRDLADRLGNLVQRTTRLLAKLAGVPRIPARSDDLRPLAEALPARIDAALAAFLPDEAAVAIVELLDAGNRYLEVTAPWRLAHTDQEAAIGALYAPLELARFAAGELQPFVPGVSRIIAARLGNVDLAPTWGVLAPGALVQVGPPPLPRT
jgi:methionyl-tRNA synthetase